MTIITSQATIVSALGELGPVRVHLHEYRITHSYLHIYLTDEGFRGKANIYLFDCDGIWGPTSGGPWRCSIDEERDAAGTTWLVFSTSDGAFRATALRVSAEIL